MKRRPIPYSTEELEWIKVHKHDVRRVSHANFCKAFNRSDIGFNNFRNLCKRKGWLTGRTGRYAPGQTPLNKGKKMPFNAGSAKTQFKKGLKPHNAKPLGYEHVKSDGYVEILIDQRNPHTGANRRFVLKHQHVWKQRHGEIPDGMCLKCLSDDKTNSDPSNWELLPRGMLPRLNGISGRGYDKAPAEIKPTIMAIAKLEHKVAAVKAGGQL